MNASKKIGCPVITEEIFETSVIMMLQNPKVKLVLVEGSTDYALFTKFIDEDKILFIDNENTENCKQAVINCIFKAINYKKSYISRIIAIIDKDFQNIQLGEKRKYPNNILFSDFHDIDAQIFFSPAFTHFFNIYIFESWKYDIKEIQDKIRDLSIEYGIYKLILHDICIPKDKMKKIYPKIEDLCNKKSFQIDSSKLKQSIENKLDSHQIIKCRERVIKRCEDLNDNSYKDISIGHDLIRILSVLIIHNFMNLKMKNLSREEIRIFQSNVYSFSRKIENHLRNSYDFDCFTLSRLYEKLDEFEAKYNVNYIKLSFSY